MGITVGALIQMGLDRGQPRQLEFPVDIGIELASESAVTEHHRTRNPGPPCGIPPADPHKIHDAVASPS
jgi:hypothetical protein